MATLKDIVNNVLTESGYQELDTVVGNGSNTARRILGLGQREGRTLAKKNWTILLKRNVLSTASSAESYALPTDFDRFIDNTHWNVSQQRRMAGPISVQHWQANKSGVGTLTVNDRFQIRADGNQNRYFIDPIPTSAESVSFFYISKAWCRANGGERQVKWLADNDVLLLDDFVYELGLKWRWLHSQRRPYQEEYGEYVVERDKAIARDGDLATLSILGPSEDIRPFANIPETGFG